MPYPGKLSRESIVQAAREMIEAEGMERLSINVLAEKLGVKTPSLYRYVGDKTGLLRAVNEDTVAGLLAALGEALNGPGTAEARLLAVALAYRQYAHEHAIAYGLAFTNTIPELRPDEAEQERGALPLQALMAQVSGDPDSLPALRGMQALIHGFVMLELAQQFRRGGDLEAAFAQSVQAYIAGWKR